MTNFKTPNMNQLWKAPRHSQGDGIMEQIQLGVTKVLDAMAYIDVRTYPGGITQETATEVFEMARKTVPVDRITMN